jgi:hypothetical protein
MQHEMKSHQCLLIASTLPQHEIAATPDFNRRRRLVDYTKCRSDGTKSPMAQKKLLADRDKEPPKKPLALGIPAFLALDASLAAMLLSEGSAEVTSQKREEERIDFYLKVLPKSVRKSTRVSTLDRVVDRK